MPDQTQFFQVETSEATLYVTVVSKPNAVLSADDVAEIAACNGALGNNFEVCLAYEVEERLAAAVEGNGIAEIWRRLRRGRQKDVAA